MKSIEYDQMNYDIIFSLIKEYGNILHIDSFQRIVEYTNMFLKIKKEILEICKNNNINDTEKEQIINYLNNIR